MFYELKCKCCGESDDYMFEMNDTDGMDVCTNCDHLISRRMDRVYNVPTIVGETCAHSCSYEGFDDGLDEYVTSKQHRAELMKQKGLTEYNPDLSMKKHRDEARRIRKDSKPGDPEAIAAIEKEYKTASDTRRNRAVKESIDKSFKEMNAQ